MHLRAQNCGCAYAHVITHYSLPPCQSVSHRPPRREHIIKKTVPRRPCEETQQALHLHSGGVLRGAAAKFVTSPWSSDSCKATCEQRAAWRVAVSIAPTGSRTRSRPRPGWRAVSIGKRALSRREGEIAGDPIVLCMGSARRIPEHAGVRLGLAALECRGGLAHCLELLPLWRLRWPYERPERPRGSCTGGRVHRSAVTRRRHGCEMFVRQSTAE